MGTIIVKNAIVRKPGYLYYVDGQGNVCQSVMSRGGRKKGKKKVAAKPARKVVSKKKK
jgi:hypothetical protein